MLMLLGLKGGSLSIHSQAEEVSATNYSTSTLATGAIKINGKKHDFWFNSI